MARVFAVLLIALWGCAAGDPAELGELAITLTAQAGGIDYRLGAARFRLQGAEARELQSGDSDELSLELPAGSYTLTLLDGWALEALGDGGAGRAVEARLVSQNPLRLEIVPGATTRAVLRFELVRADLATGTGRLEVAVEVDADAGHAACARALRIAEVDYEQAGTDEAEFIEVVSAGCTSELAGVVLELVNGGDGSVYARYELGEAADELAAGERLLVADAALLAGTGAVATIMLRSSGLQNGADAVRLVRDGVLLDGLAYAGAVSGAGEGAPAADDTDERSLSRCPDGFDSDQNELDFQLRPPTPGTANACE
jgi:hypothetical protein